MSKKAKSKVTKRPIEQGAEMASLPFQPLSKLDAIMYEQGIAQSDLVRRIAEMYETPVQQYLISRIQTGKRENYHTDTLIKICRALGVTPNDILDWENRQIP